MNSGKAEKLSSVALSVFRLNGLLIEWGNDFCMLLGLTSARWQVMGAVALAPQPPSVPQIAAFMGITRQGVQKQVNLLVEEGLFQALPNPAHKRSPLYALTRQGEETYRDLHQRWQQHVEAISSNFSTADLDAAIRVLSALSHVHAARSGTGERGVS
ncbi:MAG: MarR family transcriptional regulator [Azoarcus sp.]|jgi:DNA-binding MarR family transcriptional regulator|nr:MarR family transcriptional regulator [Azoarcus sp.]